MEISNSTFKSNYKMAMDAFGLEVVRCDKLCFVRSEFYTASSAQLRAMEISGELEPTSRGFYSGSVMYLDFSGNLNSCIAIRTISIVEHLRRIPLFGHRWTSNE